MEEEDSSSDEDPFDFSSVSDRGLELYIAMSNNNDSSLSGAKEGQAE